MDQHWIAKPHALQKYTILTKYLAACGKFARKYRNFVYVDTHGGSGIIEMDEEAPLFDLAAHPEEGSPLIAARTMEAWQGGKEFPCHIMEIHPGRYETLRQSTAEFPWVHTHHGDCNVLLPGLLRQARPGAFVLCFIDPDGLVYQGPGHSDPVAQFTWTTMEQIAQRDKPEVLLNFPLTAILRCAGYCRKHPHRNATPAMAANLTTYFGCKDWQKLRGKREFLDLYLRRLNRLRFSHVGAYYVTIGNLPLYYLVYATRSEVGARIMCSIMRKEWKAKHPRWAAEAEHLGLTYPLTGFVFDNQGLPSEGEYPPDWDEIATAVKDEADWTCEECGTPHNPDPKAGYILTVHHRDGNRANCDRENLVALCQRCHLRREQAGSRAPSPQTAEQLTMFNDL